MIRLAMAASMQEEKRELSEEEQFKRVLEESARDAAAMEKQRSQDDASKAKADE